MSPLIVLPDLTLAPEDRWLDALKQLRDGTPPGALAVQLRTPGAPGRALLRWGERLTRALAPVPLIVNDRLDVAAALGARRVHLGRHSVGVGEARALLGADLWVSRACHDLDELALAAREGASAALLSPIFSSPGKGPPLGLAALRDASSAFPALPLFALGGVDAGNAPACLAAGARGVAVIRAALRPDAWSSPALLRALEAR